MLTDLWNRLIAWTGALVTPDWGSLVARIPLLLLAVGAVFVTVTAVKWATAGPTRRGPGRRPPLAPDGAPVRVPAVGPLLLAAGAFVLALGLVLGGPWLPVGLVAAAVGLAWWAVELRRDQQGAAGARRLSPARMAVIGIVVVAVAVVVATARVVPDRPSASLPTIPPAAATPTLPPADADLVAQGIRFAPTELTAPAGRPFTVAFDNRDAVPHNLEIRDATGKPLFIGDIVRGPAVVVYDVPSLPAGQYPFICTVHPAMTGTLTVK